jgi:cation transport ATPase
MELIKMDKFESVTGKGVKAIYKGKKIALGNQKLVDEFQAPLNEDNKKIVKEWQLKAQTVMYLLIDNNVEGIVTVSDKIKESSAKAIQRVAKNGHKSTHAHRRQ